MTERFNPALVSLVHGLFSEYQATKSAFVSADQIGQPTPQPGQPGQAGPPPQAGAPDPSMATGDPTAAQPPLATPPGVSDGADPSAAAPQSQSSAQPMDAGQIRALMREELNSHAETSKTKKKLSPDERITQLESVVVKLLEHLGHVNPPPPMEQQSEQQAVAAGAQADPAQAAATPAMGAATQEPAGAMSTPDSTKSASISGPAALSAMVSRLRSAV